MRYAPGNFEPSYGLTGGKGLSPQGASQNTYDILRMDSKFDLEYAPYTPETEDDYNKRVSGFEPFEFDFELTNFSDEDSIALGFEDKSKEYRVSEILDSQLKSDYKEIKEILKGTGAASPPVDWQSDEFVIDAKLDESWAEFDDSEYTPPPEAKQIPMINFKSVKESTKIQVIETPPDSPQLISVAAKEKKKIKKLPGYLNKRFQQAGEATKPTKRNNVTVIYPDGKSYGFWKWEPAGRARVGVIISYGYKSNDGEIDEVKPFEATVRQQSGGSPYTKDVKNAIFKAEAQGRTYFENKYQIEVEVDA